MLAEIIKIKNTGVYLKRLGVTKKKEIFWLPANEWSNKYDDWKEDWDNLEAGDLVDVVETGESLSKEKVKIVSRRLFTSDNIDIDDWLYKERIMKIEDFSGSIIFGKIGNVSAKMSLFEYNKILNRKRMGGQLSDHVILSKGDFVGGVVSDLFNEDICVVLDPVQYLENQDYYVSKLFEDPILKRKIELLPETEEFKNDKFSELPDRIKEKIETVLLIENNNDWCETISRVFQDNNIEVLLIRSFENWKDNIYRYNDNCKVNINNYLNKINLAVIDPNLDDSILDLNGLQIGYELKMNSICRIIVVSGEIGSQKAEKWGHFLINSYLEKPFLLEEFIETIGEAFELDKRPLSSWVYNKNSLLAEKFVESEKAKFIKDTDIIGELNKLHDELPNASIYIFKLKRRSLRPMALYHVGPELRWEPYKWKVVKSPIKDAAFSNEPIIEIEASVQDQDEKGNLGPHFWTRRMINYESFCGINLNIEEDPHYYVLSIFHPDKNAFNDNFNELIKWTSERISRLIEKGAYRKNRIQIASLASAGLALECIAHELYNDLLTPSTMSVLLKDHLNNYYSLNNEDINEAKYYIKTINEKIKDAVDKAKVLRGIRQEKDEVDVYKCLINSINSVKRLGSEIIEGFERIIIYSPKINHKKLFIVRADYAALTIVFFNVLLNAVQQIKQLFRFRKYGFIKVFFEYIEDSKNNDWIYVYIKDSGPGIHYEDKEIIFEPGFTTKENGTGLGLYICKNLLENINEKKSGPASIVLSRSIILEGSIFIIKLPLYKILDK